MVMTTGMIRPSWSLADVLALNALQNSIMLTPCGPRAVPTGGAGVAFPAGIWSFTIPVTFFAILTPVRSQPRPYGHGSLAVQPRPLGQGYIFSTCKKSNSTG